ncbi:MAG TPA: hypothetical protein VFQ53_23650 [Kofleriaceae bacterium]|nr:hypothetical protein [Kofleriaceae bacterium]
MLTRIHSLAVFFAFLILSPGCAGGPPDTIYGDSDLDGDDELNDILGDDSLPDETPADDGTSEGGAQPDGLVNCTKRRYLHIANWSFVAALDTVNGVSPNGCWGYQRRTSGFACDYDSSQGDLIQTRAGDGPFASYNEIKPLNANDAQAVANCRTQSGGRAVRTYAVWNGSGWNNEGIAAAVKFAEVYGPQSEAAPHFWTWYNGFRDSFSPMVNISPETGVSFTDVKTLVARACSATRSGWAGIYFYDGQASGGAGMAAWKREAIIRAMNYCTTH